MRKRGFTLIELLVVIAIIGLLSSIVLSSLNTARTRARDARRMADLRQIQTALEMRYADIGTYPTETACDTSRGSHASDCTAITGNNWTTSSAFWIGLVPQYMPAIPVDPVNSTAYNYTYEPNVNNVDYCIAVTLERGGRFRLKGGPAPIDC